LIQYRFDEVANVGGELRPRNVFLRADKTGVVCAEEYGEEEGGRSVWRGGAGYDAVEVGVETRGCVTMSSQWWGVCGMLRAYPA
jgi:hypothetical protein